MNALDSSYNLLENFPRFIFGKFAAANDEIEEFAIWAVSTKQK
jgi:hypothetical protein